MVIHFVNKLCHLVRFVIELRLELLITNDFFSFRCCYSCSGTFLISVLSCSRSVVPVLFIPFILFLLLYLVLKWISSCIICQSKSSYIIIIIFNNKLLLLTAWMFCSVNIIFFCSNILHIFLFFSPYLFICKHTLCL